MLGDAQWQWFENELRNSSAQIHIIGSSIQVQSYDFSWGCSADQVKAANTDENAMQHALFAADNAHLSS